MDDFVVSELWYDTDDMDDYDIYLTGNCVEIEDVDNALHLYLILEAIYQKLLKHNANICKKTATKTVSNTSSSISDIEKFDVNIEQISKSFGRIAIIDCIINEKCLQVLSKIIIQCEETLESFRMNINFSKSNFSFANTCKSDLLKQIYAENMDQYAAYSSNKSTDHFYIFNIIKKLSQLPKLTEFEANIKNVSVCFMNFYKYLTVKTDDITIDNIPFRNLEKIRLHFTDKYNYDNDIQNSLCQWFKCHQTLRSIYITITSPKQNDKRSNVTSCVLTLLHNIIRNDTLCEQMVGFSLRDETRGIDAYKDMLIKLFECKLKCIEDITLEFNDMRDIHLNDIITAMYKSDYICNTLDSITFEWINKYYDNLYYSSEYGLDYFKPKIDNYLHYQPNFLCGQPKKDTDLILIENSNHKQFKTSYDAIEPPIEQKVNQWVDMHYAETSVEALIKLMNKCNCLVFVDMSCFNGFDDKFCKPLMDATKGVGFVKLHGIKCNAFVIENIRSLLERKYSFLDDLRFVFSDTFMCQVNIDLQTTLQALVDTIINNNKLFVECIVSVKQVLINIGYSLDVIRIILDFMFCENEMFIELRGLPNKLQVKNKKYYANCMKNRNELKLNEFDELNNYAKQRKIYYNDFVRLDKFVL